jgi:RNA polymerase sigma-70 factor (ECF subfamily)
MVYFLRSNPPVGVLLLSDEDELLAGARTFDQRALAEIHNKYYPELYRYLWYRTNDSIVADDLASEVFIRLLNALQSGRPPESIRGWLFGVAAHVVADHYRSKGRRPQVELSEELPSVDSNLDDKVNASMMNATVRNAMQDLTEEQQTVLALRFGDGWSVADTASVMRKSATAVKQLQFRALMALRRLLEPTGREGGHE